MHYLSSISSHFSGISLAVFSRPAICPHEALQRGFAPSQKIQRHYLSSNSSHTFGTLLKDFSELFAPIRHLEEALHLLKRFQGTICPRIPLVLVRSRLPRIPLKNMGPLLSSFPGAPFAPKRRLEEALNFLKKFQGTICPRFPLISLGPRSPSFPGEPFAPARRLKEALHLLIKFEGTICPQTLLVPMGPL